jgi:tetratricopeptide (TPR) repeat protein
MFATGRRCAWMLGICATLLQSGTLYNAVSAAPGTTSAAGNKAATRLLQNGENKLRHARYLEAYRCFEQAVTADTSSLQAHADLAEALAGLSKYQHAVDEYDKAIALLSKLPPNEQSAWEHKLKLARGKALHQVENYDKAVDDLSSAIKQRPDVADGYLCRAAAYDALGKFDDAFKDIAKAIELQPDSAAPYIQRAIIYKEQKQADKALADYAQAAKLDPKLIQHRAAYLKEQGRPEEAIADYSAAIGVHDGAQKAAHYYDRGLIYEDSDHHRMAISDYTQAIQIQPTSPDYYWHRANSYFGVSDFKHAIADYTKAIQLAPARADNYFKRAEAYEEDGQKTLAIADFNKAIELIQDGNGKYFVKRALLRSQLGDHDGAVQDITKAISLCHDDPEYYFDRGLEYTATGKYTESVDDLSKCIAIEPQFACAYKNRAMARVKLGDEQGAMQDLEESNKLYEHDGDRHGCAEVARLMTRMKHERLSTSSAN